MDDVVGSAQSLHVLRNNARARARTGDAHLKLHVAHVTQHAAWPFGQGGFFFFFEREPPARCFFFAFAKWREGRKKMATGARTGGEPLIGTTALQRGTPPGARGGKQMLGQVCIHMQKQKFVTLVQSRLSSNDVDDELSAPEIVACESHSSSIVDVLSELLDKDPRRALLTTSQ